ncbi:ribosome-recycling factor, chloroplastic-like [Castanea sativa]|uniref:ribosome-recycling factor, chloroplastic-like n=1 Tax=Castanea sativa TaxID=21020 RepID=UPI003F64DF1C
MVAEVEYYGSPVSLKSIAHFSTPDASSLLVQPYDKSSLRAIEKAIVGSDLGMTPNNDGEVIRLTLPQLTSERRKVALRNIRRDALKACEKLEKIGLIVCIVGACQLLHDWLTKKTRAIRRRLTKRQASLKTKREKKKEMYFPMWKYAIKV